MVRAASCQTCQFAVRRRRIPHLSMRYQPYSAGTRGVGTMTALLVALVVFLGLIVLLLWAAYAEVGRDLPCKRARRSDGQKLGASEKQRHNDSSHTRRAA